MKVLLSALVLSENNNKFVIGSSFVKVVSIEVLVRLVFWIIGQ